ncbi:sigma-54-dependent transcriptional regulator [Pseudoalteromonas fenneropenaei]|uniref:Sigma-54-dependent transcriptional regulator n=1 Tax=Pseudoalteromonas fenneropenaei TaxID=1737459 RepID=A0ABV7CNX2_9GAMM
MGKHTKILNGIGAEDLIISRDEDFKACILAKNEELASIVQGETGTGKEEFAKLIHRKREYYQGEKVPFVSVNCANFNNELSLSLLFGHVKGAFSGADKTTEGFIAEANGGILFLDEIHTLSIETQQKLLRVLNDGSYSRLGDTKTLYSKFQVIAATTRDLDAEVENGSFLLDLRFRLLGIEMTMKPLRERKEDIPKFVDAFLNKKGITLSPAQYTELLSLCKKCYWQGNIRQLFNVLNAWVAMCDGKLNVAYFPQYNNMYKPSVVSKAEKESYKKVISVLERAVSLDISFTEAIEEVECFILEEAMGLNPSISDVYQGLQLSRNNFYVKRRKYGLA